MRYSQAEKMEIIKLVENSEIGVKRTLEELSVCRSSYYRWYQKYTEEGFEGLSNRKSNPKRIWNKIPDEEKEKVVAIALELPDQSPRQLAWHITDKNGYYISESSVY